jgi:copper chaperone
MIEFHLPDMTCGHCASKVTRSLKQADPACVLNIDLKAQKVQVQSSEDRQTLVEALTGAGYRPA